MLQFRVCFDQYLCEVGHEWFAKLMLLIFISLLSSGWLLTWGQVAPCLKIQTACSKPSQLIIYLLGAAVKHGTRVGWAGPAARGQSAYPAKAWMSESIPSGHEPRGEAVCTETWCQSLRAFSMSPNLTLLPTTIWKSLVHRFSIILTPATGTNVTAFWQIHQSTALILSLILLLSKDKD